MDGKQLKNSILQWAIQGKLVPQNLKDEPASKLLEHIAASRNESALSQSKGAKSKKFAPTSRIYRENGVWYEQVGNAEPKDISDDIPFEIPENWAWCRFSQVISIASNLVDSSKYLEYKHIAPDNIEKGSGKLLPCKTVAEDKVISNNHFFRKGQIIYSKIRPLLRKCVIAPFDGLCSADMYPLKTVADDAYIVKLLLSDMFNKQVADICASRVKMPKINQEELSGILLPLPPLAEQKRIVAKLEQILPLADEYGAAQEQLDKLNKELPEALKKSILQQAIQGKLVPQLKNDGNAEDLLKKLIHEKECLENKSSKKACEKKRPVHEDEIPFQIPENWIWTRLSSIATMYTGNSISENEKRAKYTNVIGTEYIGTKDVSFDHDVDYKNGIAIPPEYISNFKIAPANSILLCIEGGSAGRKICLINKDVCFGNKLCCFIPPKECVKYLYYYLQSPAFFDVFRDNKTGMIGGVSVNTLKDLIIPLPPLAEQKRIVTKLEQLFKAL